MDLLSPMKTSAAAAVAGDKEEMMNTNNNNHYSQIIQLTEIFEKRIAQYMEVFPSVGTPLLCEFDEKKLLLFQREEDDYTSLLHQPYYVSFE